MAIFLILFVIALIYLLSIQGRRNHPGLHVLRGWYYAHRGLHDAALPENSMGAFRAALEHGFGIELDIHLMADGNLAVIHDSSLQRTAGANVAIESLTTGQLANYRLNGTEETIPLFSDVLALFNGAAPLIIELKTAGGNADRLCEAACAMLESYNGPYCIESFDPRCIIWLKKHRPQIIRGQLAENSLHRHTSIPWILRFVMTNHLLNFLSQPDFIAYNFPHRKTLGTFLCRKLWGVQGVAWTLRTKEAFDTAISEGWIPIFEGFLPK